MRDRVFSSPPGLYSPDPSSTSPSFHIVSPDMARCPVGNKITPIENPSVTVNHFFLLLKSNFSTTKKLSEKYVIDLQFYKSLCSLA